MPRPTLLKEKCWLTLGYNTAQFQSLVQYHLLFTCKPGSNFYHPLAQGNDQYQGEKGKGRWPTLFTDPPQFTSFQVWRSGDRIKQSALTCTVPLATTEFRPVFWAWSHWSANYSVKARSSPPSIFVNKVSFEQNHVRSITYCLPISLHTNRAG